jgi:hypothetical protein
MLKMVPSIGFGLIDYFIMVFRGAFVVYPWFKFLGDYNDKTEEINKNKTKKDKKKKRKNKKANQIQEHEFIKEMPTKRIHAFWKRTKNDVKVFIRISFLGNNPNKNDPLMKKHLLKYNLKIINNKKPTFQDHPQQNESKFLLLLL